MPAHRRSWPRAAAVLAGTFLFVARASAGAGGTDTVSTGTKLATHPAVLLARRFAAEKIVTPRCRAIYAEFADATGRPLARRLAELGLSPAEHLARLVFEDGEGDPPCHDPVVLAFTSPLSPVVHVCTSRFARTMHTSPPVAIAIVLHEQLHTLGLLEDPPTPQEITERILQRCGR